MPLSEHFLVISTFKLLSDAYVSPVVDEITEQVLTITSSYFLCFLDYLIMLC
jgi:hypothetical protein